MAVDIGLVMVLAAGFVLGFFRGLVRQMLAIGVWLVVFVAAAYARVPLGEWLARSSPDYVTAYSTMLAFLALFVVLFGAVLALVELGGGPSRLTRHPVLDDALGGVLGLFLAALTVGSLMVILESYLGPAGPPRAGEIGWLRELYSALRESVVGQAIDSWIVRAMGVFLGPLLPIELRAVLG